PPRSARLVGPLPAEAIPRAALAGIANSRCSEAWLCSPSPIYERLDHSSLQHCWLLGDFSVFRRSSSPLLASLLIDGRRPVGERLVPATGFREIMRTNPP